MEESEIKAPFYYILGRDTPREEMDAALWVFNITPCSTGVVSRHEDRDLINPVVFQVLKASDESACRELAAHLARTTGTPTLTVGEGSGMTAVFYDGSEADICLTNLKM